MAIALFNDQDVLAGQKLGISTAKAIALMVMASGLGAMNIYHMGNSITNKLLSPDSSLLLYALLYFIAACIAFIEVPITEEIVTKEARGHRAFGHRIILAVVACMAMGGGVYSITTDAQKTDATRTAHTTHESGFEDLKQSLISDRNAARSKAKNAAERSQANSDYFNALATLKKQQANHQSNRPTEAIKTGSFWHWLWACGFSFLCSIGVIVITAYLAKYHKPLTEIPRVFFRVKEDQEWQMNDDDVRVIPAHVDLSNGQSNPSARSAMNATPSLANQNRPAPDDSTLGAASVGHHSVGERSPKVAYSAGHYQAIKAGILARDFNPTQAPVKSALVTLKVQFVDDAARQKKAVEILDQLKAETVIIDNPARADTKQNLAKYVVNPDYLTNADEAVEATIQNDDDEEGIGEFDIVTRCPRCNDYNVTDIVLLIDDQQQIARCDCGHNYVAHTHIANGFNPISDALLTQARERNKSLLGLSGSQPESTATPANR